MVLDANGFPLLPVGSQAWGAARRVSKDDWLEWLRRLSLELLKDSSSPSLRSCWALAQAYNPMARYGAGALCPPLFGISAERMIGSFSETVVKGLVCIILLTCEMKTEKKKTIE